MLFFDFESYFSKKYKYSLSKLSDIQYICDPRFQVVSVAILVNEKITVYSGLDETWIALMRDYNKKGYRFIAHNARFDLRVLALRYGFIPDKLSDTMLMARYLGYANCDLATLSANLLTDRKLHLETDGKRLEQIPPEEWVRLCEYNSKDVELTKKLYDLFLPLMPAHEEALIEQTLRLCLKTHAIDWTGMNALRTEAKKIVSLLSYGDWESIKSELPEDVQNLPEPDPTLLCELEPLVRKSAALLPFIYNKAGVLLTSIDKKKLVYESLPDLAKIILSIVWRRKEAEKDVKAFETIKDRIAVPGIDRAMLDMNYSKATTHRWASGGEEGQQSFNMQNMKKSGGIRELWVPDPGHVYCIVDLAQIEARVVAWYGNETVLLNDFAGGKDPYCTFGQYIFGHVLDKKTENQERQICKTAILGLGFGMGAAKFLSRLEIDCPEAWATAVAKIGSPTPLDAATVVVTAYRKAYRGISSLARKSQQAFVAAVLTREPQTIGGRVNVGYNSDENVLVVRLPTGGVIRYRDVDIQPVPSKFSAKQVDYEISYATRTGRRTLQFSTPIENIVQATARDILSHQLISLETAGCDIRFHAHDEVIQQCTRAEADEILSLTKTVFASPDRTCPGLPLACSAFLSDRYTKDEQYMLDFTTNLLAI